MLFNSLAFLVFLAVVLALYRALPHRAQNAMLLGASYVFYGWWDWRFLSLIWFSTLLDFVAAQLIAGSGRPGVRRGALLTSIVVQLSLLGFFKYWNFFVDSLDLALSPFGLTAAGLHLDLVLPIGISFYTFQTMAYTIDVYRRDIEPVRNLLDFALFICFFPQLVAGPIERASNLVPQVQNPRRVTRDDLHQGMTLFIWGLCKKVFVADNLATIVDPVYTLGAQPTGLEVLIATFAFTFQVYADFSAYSDIARGTANMLGFHLMENFQIPFFSRDHGEWWRRWHISLSTWLRDYLYFPLGGNRRSEPRVAFNLFVTMFLSGLWHGSRGTFLAFGSYMGIVLVLSRLYRQRFPARDDQARWPGAIVSVCLFALGTVFFRGQTIQQCLHFLALLATDVRWEPVALGSLVMLVGYGGPLLAFDFLHWHYKTDTFVLRWPFPARVAACVAALHAIFIWGRSSSLDFVYFQF